MVQAWPELGSGKVRSRSASRTLLQVLETWQRLLEHLKTAWPLSSLCNLSLVTFFRIASFPNQRQLSQQLAQQALLFLIRRQKRA